MWLLDELSKFKNSDNLAVVHRENQITFKQLWERSEKVASYINSVCKTSSPIVIYGNKEIDIITVMIAALKTGRAYVPVDVTYPEERLYKIANVTETEIIFNFSEIELTGNFKFLKQTDINKICLENKNEISKENWVKDEDTCYILFTSGSTGEPKGVQISKKNINNFVLWFKDMCFIPKDKQVVLNQVSYSFDVSDIAIYIYLAMGKTLFNVDKHMAENPKELFSYLKTSDISVWVSTPAFLEICNFDDSFNSELLPKLEKFILAGEVLTKNLVNSIWKKFSDCVVINGYGPTEGTVLLSACEISHSMIEDKKSLPIGKVIPEALYYIVNEKGNEVENGEQGELVVVSNSISDGYFKNKEQSEKKFFKDKDKRNGYKTGDLVFESDGLLYYIARKDFQIKLNGFRIELDDIAQNLNKIEYISNSVVMPVYKDERVNYLVAFVVLNCKVESSNLKFGIKIKNDLRKLVPSYMVPRKIKILESFPLNTNGKIDRKKLMEEI